MFGNGNARGRAQRGSALLVVMILMVVTSGLLAAMMTMHMARDDSQFDADMRIVRSAAAEAGLERAKLETATDGTWLANNVGRTQAVFTGGANYFDLGSVRVTLNVTKADADWYLVKSSAVSTVGRERPVTTMGMTAKGGTMFSDYARFVSAGILDIGDYASYGGKVHCNSHINIPGGNVIFYEDVTAVGHINYQERNNVIFYKRATPGAPSIALPGADQLIDLCRSAPAGALIYDWTDAAYIAKFRAATGANPTSNLTVKITFNRNKMTVVSTSGTKVMTETNINVPHEGTIYCKGQVTVSGQVSRRLSVETPSKIYIDGPLRYTDDSGNGQWQLQDSAGNPMPFDATTQSWSHMGNWTGPGYQYVEAADWEARMPVVDGKKVQPTLGLVNADTIYISGANDNREIHAALFSSGDVIRPNVSGQKKNLYILGCIITTGTNPVSSFFSYRCYSYDPYLKGNPPPGFPGGDAASFRNWHVIDLEKR